MTLDRSYIAPDLRALAVPIETLNPMPGNARKHVLDKDVAVLAGVLRDYGQVKAIVGKHLYRGVENAVIAGNGTLMAARSLGWTHIAVSWLPDDYGDDRAQALALADNRVAELSEWDYSALSEQLASLADLDPGLPASLGWDEGDAALLLASRWEAPQPEPLPSEVAEPPVTIILSATQSRVVQRAVARVRAMESDPRMTVGRALELVAADFMAGAGDA